MDIPVQYKELWSNWDVRVLILLSLSIQIILIFLGRMRRTFNSRLIRMILWSCYLLADWVADFVLGKLSSSMDESSASNAIIAFWAPFLILHLGGPDTITAYSMEDNELWARHLLGLIYELFIAFYVLFRSLPNTNLLAPTLLMFLVAIIKYVERSYSLYRASIEGFRNSIRSFDIEKPPEDLITLKKVFWLYSANKPSFIDAIPYFEGRDKTVIFMKKMSSEEILRVMSMELSYAYDEFYTKAIVSHSRAGYFLRVLCSICILLAFSLFIMVPKDDFKNVDVAITYVLLISSICLDVVAAVMFVFSNWMVVSLLNVKKLSNWSMWFAEHIVRIKRACHRRRYWMIKMPQLNLLTNCLTISTPNKALRERIMNWVAEKLSLVQVTKLEKPSLPYFVVGQNYTLQTMQPTQATQEFMEIIASNLKRHGNLTEEEFKKPAGFSMLQKVTTITEWAIPTFVQLFEGMPLDQHVLVWHITTELCFHCNLEPQYNYLHQAEIEVKESKLGGDMEACKYLSDYMMHMVLMQSDMMSTMGGVSSLIFYRTVNEMVRFIRKSVDTEVKELCKKIMATPIDWHSDEPLFTTSKVLAHLMLFIAEQDRWQVLATIWVDLLIKGAKNSKASTHMKQLSRGDELLTFIWLFNKQALLYEVTETDSVRSTFNNIFEKGKYLHDQIEDHRSQYRSTARDLNMDESDVDESDGWRAV